MNQSKAYLCFVPHTKVHITISLDIYQNEMIVLDIYLYGNSFISNKLRQSDFLVGFEMQDITFTEEYKNLDRTCFNNSRFKHFNVPCMTP